MKNDDRIKVAQKRARAKINFFRHFTFYVLATAGLIVVNNVVSHENQWWIWPAVVWGLLVCGHFLITFLFGSQLEQKIAEIELENLDEDEKKNIRGECDE